MYKLTRSRSSNSSENSSKLLGPYGFLAVPCHRSLQLLLLVTRVNFECLQSPERVLIPHSSLTPRNFVGKVYPPNSLASTIPSDTWRHSWAQLLFLHRARTIIFLYLPRTPSGVWVWQETSSAPRPELLLPIMTAHLSKVRSCSPSMFRRTPRLPQLSWTSPLEPISAGREYTRMQFRSITGTGWKFKENWTSGLILENRLSDQIQMELVSCSATALRRSHSSSHYYKCSQTSKNLEPIWPRLTVQRTLPTRAMSVGSAW